MAVNGRIRAIILALLIIILGIIHFAVGIGIVARYRKYGDVFQQQVSLSGYNIFIGLCAIVIGVIALISILRENCRLCTIIGVAACVLGIITFASLIAALVLSSQAAKYLSDTIYNDMYEYTRDDDSKETVNKIQQYYQCCGVNLWLDWSQISLGLSNGIGNGRRRRHLSLPSNFLTQVLRQKRQSISPGNTIYNLPATYSVALPLSCCRAGGTIISNSLGGYCQANVDDNGAGFYTSGCLVPIASIAFAQIAGIVVINTCLAILGFVCFAKHLNLFPKDDDDNSNEPDNKQQTENEIYQQQAENGMYQQQTENQIYQQQQEQYPYGQYYVGNINSYPYYTSSPTYKTYL